MGHPHQRERASLRRLISAYDAAELGLRMLTHRDGRNCQHLAGPSSASFKRFNNGPRKLASPRVERDDRSKFQILFASLPNKAGLYEGVGVVLWCRISTQTRIRNIALDWPCFIMKIDVQSANLRVDPAESALDLRWAGVDAPPACLA